MFAPNSAEPAAQTPPAMPATQATPCLQTGRAFNAWGPAQLAKVLTLWPALLVVQSTSSPQTPADCVPAH